MIKYYSTTISGKLYGIVELDENFNVLASKTTTNPNNKEFRQISDRLKDAIDSGNVEIDEEKSDYTKIVYILDK